MGLTIGAIYLMSAPVVEIIDLPNIIQASEIPYASIMAEIVSYFLM
jgi:hypothetical protein